MTEHNESPMTESHWLNWCRLCAKDDLRGNVKVCTSENANNTWNSVLVMAIRKYFDVHMQMEDELSGVLCKECYTLMSELIDFAKHVNKVQAIFEILRRSEPSDHLDVEALKQQYGLREGDWTHIIKAVLDIENNVAIKDLTGVTKQEFVDLGEVCESETSKTLENLDKMNVNSLPIEEIIIPGWDATNVTQNKTNRRLRGRRRTCTLSKSDSTEKVTKEKGEEEPDAVQKVEIIDEKPITAEYGSTHLDADLEFLPEIPTTSLVEPEFQVGFSSDSDREDIRTDPDDLESSSKRKKIQCKWCNKVYHNPASYQKHLRNVCRKSENIRTETDDLDSSPKRRKRKKLVCKWCDKVYHNPTSYQKHLRKGCRKVERKVDQNANCELCNKTLSSSSALKLHMEGMHKDFKRFICDHCGKQLKTITALSEHKLVHTDDRPFVCAVCSTGFKNKARLRVHSKTHEKPNYECNICGKKLQTRRTWNMHKVVHSEDRKFKCDVCDALFKRSKTLKRHLLTHTGLRPFACNYCEQAFRCNSNLRIHKLHRHPHEFKKEEDGVLPSRVRIPTLDELPVMSKLKTEP
ncbi:hypothetical protein ACLKA7_010683 [Drosophila subpalustris]